MPHPCLNTRAKATKPKGGILRSRKCRLCRKPYAPMSDSAEVCSWDCGLQLTRQRESKALKRKRLEISRDLKARREKIKTHSQWTQEVQREFNRFIRARDSHLPCISCGRDTGAKRNAGHYKAVGSHPELRFNEFNCHGQCEHCNSYRSGNLTEYRVALVAKIGLSLVEWLESSHPVSKFTIEELKCLKSVYRIRAKQAESSE